VDGSDCAYGVCRVWTVRVLRSFVDSVDSVDSMRMDGSGDISAYWSLIKVLNVNKDILEHFAAAEAAPIINR